MIPKVESARIGGRQFRRFDRSPREVGWPCHAGQEGGGTAPSARRFPSRRDTAQPLNLGCSKPSTERTSQDRRNELRMFGAANLAPRIRGFVSSRFEGRAWASPPEVDPASMFASAERRVPPAHTTLGEPASTTTARTAYVGTLAARVEPSREERSRMPPAGVSGGPAKGPTRGRPHSY